MVFDKLILYHPGGHLSIHRWSFSVYSQHCRWLHESDVMLCQVVTFSFPLVISVNLQHQIWSILPDLTEERHEHSSIWLQQLISVTGTVCTMGTHALRVLRGVVDLSGRSHVQWRGHRWSQVTHRVKHWRPKSWLKRQRISRCTQMCLHCNY